ncbi:MAG: hypothetical protein WBZ36_11840 [Candidatus Nitrosopolaris sp.]
MAKGNHKVIDFLIQMAEDPAKAEEYKLHPNKVLSTFDFPDDIKSDIVSGRLENITDITESPPPRQRTAWIQTTNKIKF